MKQRAMILLLAMCTFPLTSFASFLGIEIANNTNDTCVLIDENLMHGMLYTTPPPSIKKDEHDEFYMWQSLFSRGPKIELTYMCNKMSITFLCEEGTTIVSHGKLYASIVRADPSITASFRTKQGSILWNQRGRINVVISQKL